MSWTEAATHALISIWGEKKIQQGFDGTRRNASIYGEMADKLREMGFDFTTKQVVNKCKNLRRHYTSAKDENNKSGNAPTDWIYFPEMDEIFGERPVSRPAQILDGMNDVTFESLYDESLGSSVEEVGEEVREEAGSSSLLSLLEDDGELPHDVLVGQPAGEDDNGTEAVKGVVSKKRKSPSAGKDKQDNQKCKSNSKEKKKAKVDEMVSSFTEAVTKVSKDFGDAHFQNQLKLQENMFKYEERRRKEEAEEKRKAEERAHQRQLELFAMFSQARHQTPSAVASLPVASATHISMDSTFPSVMYPQTPTSRLPSTSHSQYSTLSRAGSSKDQQKPKNMEMYKPWL